MLLSRSAIYTFSVAFTALVFTDPISFFGWSEYSSIIKYCYTAVAVALIIMYAVKYNSVNVRMVAPLIALSFFVMSTGVFLFNLINYGYRLSYASAFTSALLFAAAAFIPYVVIDVDRILKYLRILFMFCAGLYLAEALFKLTSFGRAHAFAPDVEFGRSIVPLIGLCTAILQRQRLLACLFLVTMVVAVVARPTSTFILAAIICLPLTLALRSQAIGISRFFSNTVLAVAAFSPFALYFFFDRISELIQLAESSVKSDVLGAHSNADFRLIIINQALRQWVDQSILIGSGLDGNTTVFIGREMPNWIDAHTMGLATIHSDFLINLTQSGLIGYAFFITLLYLVLNSRFRALRVAAACNRPLFTLISVSIIAAVALITYCSVNPFLQYYYVAHPIWMLFFISELAVAAALSPSTNRDTPPNFHPTAGAVDPVQSAV
jgi:hypothetical protein